MGSEIILTTPPMYQYRDSQAETVKPIHRDIRGIIHIMTFMDWFCWEFLAVSLS